jgi:hypothetical protein
MVNQHEQDLNVPLLLDEQQLTAQLLRNRDALRNSTALFNGVPINYETELTRYERFTSIIIFHRWEYSRYFVYEKESPGTLPRDFILHSLFWGWWSFPWGVCAYAEVGHHEPDRG